jgi:hypothetical protein
VPIFPFILTISNHPKLIRTNLPKREREKKKEEEEEWKMRAMEMGPTEEAQKAHV